LLSAWRAWQTIIDFATKTGRSTIYESMVCNGIYIVVYIGVEILGAVKY
jgi:hypothetical protein